MPRHQVARVEAAFAHRHMTVKGARVGGSSATVVGGGLGLVGIYLMMFGSPVTQPLGIVLGAAGLLAGAYLERSN